MADPASETLAQPLPSTLHAFELCQQHTWASGEVGGLARILYKATGRLALVRERISTGGRGSVQENFPMTPAAGLFGRSERSSSLEERRTLRNYLH